MGSFSDMAIDEATTTSMVKAQAIIERLVAEGWLIGISVFGTDRCCTHGEHAECESTSFGLCDQFAFGRTSDPADPTETGRIVGSDCNRAEQYIMRPHDRLMSPTLRDLLADQPD